MARILSRQDRPQPHEIAESSFDVVLKRHGGHPVYHVLLAEQALVDDLGSGKSRLLADLDLEAPFAVQLGQLGLARRLAGQSKVVHGSFLVVRLRYDHLSDLLPLVVHSALLDNLRLLG